MSDDPTFLGTAVERRWLLKVKCERRRAGLKSVRSCPLPSVLQPESLMAVLGATFPIADLRRAVSCPRCGSKHVTLSWVLPPQKPGRAKAATMKPIAPSEPDLGRYSGLTVVVACMRCQRRGAYRTKGLADRFGGETFLTEVPQRVAESRGCTFARADLLDPRPDGDRRCCAHLDVEGHWRQLIDD